MHDQACPSLLPEPTVILELKVLGTFEIPGLRHRSLVSAKQPCPREGESRPDFLKPELGRQASLLGQLYSWNPYYTTRKDFLPHKTRFCHETLLIIEGVFQTKYSQLTFVHLGVVVRWAL